MNGPQKPQHLAMGWFYRDQWENIRRVSTDGDRMAVIYDDWLQQAEKAFEQMKASGFTPHKVYLDVDGLVKWAASQGRSINAETRRLYALALFGAHLGPDNDRLPEIFHA